LFEANALVVALTEWSTSTSPVAESSRQGATTSSA
jgi:hypothetical protein